VHDVAHEGVALLGEGALFAEQRDLFAREDEAIEAEDEGGVDGERVVGAEVRAVEEIRRLQGEIAAGAAADAGACRGQPAGAPRALRGLAGA
jgi:hypothetical protein